MSKADEDQLRANEAILDRHYKTLSFVHQPPRVAVYALLAVYDSMSLPMAIVGRPLGAELKIKRLEEGLGQALKWILSEGWPDSVLSTCTSSVLNDGYEFLSHASDYVDLADFHKMFGRGLVDIESPAESTINFVPKGGGRAEMMGLLESVASSRRRVQEAFDISPKAREKLVERFLQVKHELQDGRIVFSSFRSLAGVNIVREFGSFVPRPPFSLAPDMDLQGFTAGELRAFWVSLFFWSQMAIHRFLALVSNGVPQCECMPAQVVKRERFVEDMASISGLDGVVIANIVDRVSLLPAPGNAIDPTIRPLLAVGDCLLWSNLYVMSYRPERNVLRLMTRDPKLKFVADNLIGGREHQVVREIEKRLKERGYHTRRNVDISLAGEAGEIDVLAWHSSHPSQVLLVEVKAVLAPDEVNEVDSATKLMMLGQRQLEKVIRILNGVSARQRRQWFDFVRWDLVRDYFGIVVSAEGEPSSLMDSTRFPGIAATTFDERIGKACYRSPKTLVACVRKRPWLGDAVEQTLGRITLSIGDLKYGMPSWEASS